MSGRLSKVCEHCQKRKIKCDRKRPCSQCKKLKNIECIYNNWEAIIAKDGKLTKRKSSAVLRDEYADIKRSDSAKAKPWMLFEFNKTNLVEPSNYPPSLTSRLDQSTMRSDSYTSLDSYGLSQKPQTVSKHVCLYSKYSSVSIDNSKRVGFGPFTWPSFIKADPYLKALEGFILEEKGYLRPTDSNSKSGEVPNIREASINSNPIRSRCDMPVSSQKRSITYKSLSDSISYQLPKKKVIDILVDIFFSTIYMYCPIVDEFVFKSRMKSILVFDQNSSGRVVNLNMESMNDFAYIGTLIIILRFSFCSLLNGSQENISITIGDRVDPSDVDLLISNPVTLDLLGLAKECMEQFKLGKGQSLEVLQFMMIYKFYHRYALETNDGVDECDAFIHLSTVLTMAKSLGLNREPKEFGELMENRKKCHLLRKIWYTLVIWDIRSSFITGNHMQVYTSQYDTQFPVFADGCSNVSDIKVEQQAVDVFAFLMKYYSDIRKMLVKALDMTSKMSIDELYYWFISIDELLSKFSLNLNSLVGLRTVSSKSFDILTTVSAMNYFEIKCFIISGLFLLFLNLEESNDIHGSFAVAEKLIFLISSDVMLSCFSFFDNRIFCNFLVHPSIESIIQKTNIVLIAFIARVQAIDRSDVETSEINKLYENILECAHNFLLFSSILSDKYYYAWQTTKFQKYLLGTISPRDFTKLKGTETGCIIFSRYAGKFSSIMESAIERTSNTSLKVKGTDKKFNHFYYNSKDYASEIVNSPQQNPEPPKPTTFVRESMWVNGDHINASKIFDQSASGYYSANFEPPFDFESNEFYLDLDNSSANLALDELFYWPDSFIENV